ncbi:MAG: TonB-dependent receptor [Candidatus Hydrothermales bacterium]
MRLKIMCSFLLAGFLVSILWAGTTGKISGRVTDATTGEGLPFAIVKIVGTQMGTYTDDQGYFVILKVPPGKYDIEVTYAGYQPSIIKGVAVEADRTVEVNVALKPTTVEVPPIVVEAKEELIRADLPESRKIMKKEEVANIPVMSIQGVVEISVGVVERGGLHIRGSRPDEVVYVVNGVEVRDPFTAFTAPGIPLLAMEEAGVSTGGFDVDQGSAAGGMINVVTKGGGDKYSSEYRFSTTNLSFLGEGINSFFNVERGDYIRDFLLGINKDMGTTKGKRHRRDEILNEFSLSGPIPFMRREAASFLISGDYITHKGRFPVYADEKKRIKNYGLSWRLDVRPSLYLLLYFTGFYRFERFGVYDPQFRLLPDLSFEFHRYLTSFSGGINWLVAQKYMNEINFGFFQRSQKRNIFEDMDKDGVDDFDDRDLDGFAEIDIDYFKRVYYDPVRGTWVIDPNYWYGIDSIAKMTNLKRENFNVNEKEGYVELPFFWWEDFVYGFYPGQSAAHPQWWPTDMNAPLNRYGWGQSFVQDFDVIEVVLPDGSIDTFVDMQGVYYPYPLQLDWRFFETQRMSFLPPGSQIRRTILSVGNLYLPYPHNFERDQWGYLRNNHFTLSWKMTAQLTKKTKTAPGHEILMGAEFKRINLMVYDVDFASGGNIYLQMVNPPLSRRSFDTTYTFVDWLNAHKVKPYQFAFFLRDKIEMEGMYARVGVRFDYIDNDGYYSPILETRPQDAFVVDPVYGVKYFSVAENTKPYWIVSPRIGVSHPITERDVLHFTYGHYYQIPSYNQTNFNYVVTGAFPIIGNPKLKPEKTVSYELGVKHGFTPEFIVDVTAFYKDIQNWARTKFYKVDPLTNVTTFYNEDYGSSRGIEIEIIKRPAGTFIPYLSLNINYTFQVARGSFSSPYLGYYWQWLGYPLPPRESPLDWDQTHTINAVISWIVPKNRKFLRLSDYGISLQYSYGSGYPWTPPIRSERDAIELINARRLPSTKDADLRIYKNFPLLRGKGNLQLFVDIYNIFNYRNLVSIEDENWYDQFGDPEGEVKNIGVWSARRQTRIGFYVQIGGF